MAIQDGLRLVDQALKEFFCQAADGWHLPRPFQTLQPDVAARVIHPQTGTVFHECVSSCGKGYDAGNLEIQMWHFSLMFAEFVSGMLELKGKDGNCGNPGHPKPCRLTRELHLKMLRRFKADLEALIREIDVLDKASANWPTAGIPAAGP